jgi:Na+-driven multidrug efflux pump
MRSIGKAGIPQMLEFVVIYAMDMVLNMIIISCGGSEGLTLFSMPDSIVAMMIVPAMATGPALVTVASSAYGQRNVPRMQEAFRFSLKFGIGIVLVTVVIAELIPSVIMGLFTYSQEMVEYRQQMVDIMRIIALYAPLFSVTPICSGYLQAMKHPEYSVVIAIVRNLILIGLFSIAATISLTAICWFLDLGHLIGALIISAVTVYTFRHMRLEMPEPAQE